MTACQDTLNELIFCHNYGYVSLQCVEQQRLPHSLRLPFDKPRHVLNWQDFRPRNSVAMYYQPSLDASDTKETTPDAAATNSRVTLASSVSDASVRVFSSTAHEQTVQTTQAFTSASDHLSDAAESSNWKLTVIAPGLVDLKLGEGYGTVTVTPGQECCLIRCSAKSDQTNLGSSTERLLFCSLEEMRKNRHYDKASTYIRPDSLRMVVYSLVLCVWCDICPFQWLSGVKCDCMLIGLRSVSGSLVRMGLPVPAKKRNCNYMQRLHPSQEF